MFEFGIGQEVNASLCELINEFKIQDLYQQCLALNTRSLLEDTVEQLKKKYKQKIVVVNTFIGLFDGIGEKFEIKILSNMRHNKGILFDVNKDVVQLKVYYNIFIFSDTIYLLNDLGFDIEYIYNRKYDIHTKELSGDIVIYVLSLLKDNCTTVLSFKKAESVKLFRG